MIRSRRRPLTSLAILAAVTVALVAPGAAAAACPCSIWGPGATPGVAADNDTRAVELGLKFRSDVAGHILGVRFYKSLQNTGVHAGKLYTAGGSRLAIATFANETPSGWQEVRFPAPVAIAANTTYVAAYHTRVGRYANDDRFFQTAGVDTPPLHALRSGVSGVNGVFRYSATGAFPNQASLQTNYWVDVVFVESTADTTAPTLTARTPAPGASGVPVGTDATATFSEPVASLSVQFRLTGPGGTEVPSTVTYDAIAQRARLVPTAPLAAGTTYTATVSGAQDNAGNTMAPASWSFSTAAAADTTAPSVVSRTPAAGAADVPAAVNPSATFDEDVVAASVRFTLTGPGGAAVPASTAYDAATRTARLTPTAPLAAGTAYSASVSEARDAAGNVMAPVTWSFTTAAAAPTGCPCTLWPGTAVPAIPAAADNSAVELGVRFRSDESGFITGLRFHKGAGNSGTHRGHLWTDSGELLAEAAFVNETASGWQQVTLPAPVPVQANTTYVASYHTTTGFYSADNDYFTTAGVDRAPLHAPRDGLFGANGVYRYGASGFPVFTHRSTNYWVDVVFERTATDTTAPTVIGRAPAPGSTTAPATTNVTATFSEPVEGASVAVELTGPGGAVGGTTTYDQASRTVSFSPDGALAHSTQYGVRVSGARDAAGNTMAPVTWTFSTAAPPPPPPEAGPGGPVLLVTADANPFTKYYSEILRAEGLNAFSTVEVAALSPAALAGKDVVVLGQVGLSPAQVTAVTDFVTSGGHLIAMRPGPELAGLLGVTRVPGELSDAYLKVDATREPGAGITAETMQFHGTADRVTLSGATSVAALYANATDATPNPAVTLRAVGSNGGSAAAFTFDLARSVVLTRQGNPAWAGLERDGISPIRSDDQFFGGGTAPDWIDLSRVAIPQADEQQRLFANLVLTMSRSRKPLPRFWYFPRSLKAVIVGTGDDHGQGGTAGRFDQYNANSPAGCSAADWTCLRFSSYIYAGTPVSNTQAAAFDAQGHEVGLHVSTGCANYTPESLQNDFSGQLSEWRAKYTAIQSPVSNRTHCITWSDWSGTPVVELANGIRLDTNYYYWPGSWIADRPGFFTGSGFPMRFTRPDGTMVNVYQATSQMTDESNQSYPATPAALIDGALGPNGYYGAFTVNMHTDAPVTPESDGVLSAALARQVPIVSARQLLTWLDARNAATFRDLAWSGDTLTFSVDAPAAARNLTVMLPVVGAGGARLGSLTLNGGAVGARTETIKGLEYALFTAAAGTYAATYSGATAPGSGGSAATLAPGTSTAAPAATDTGAGASPAPTAAAGEPAPPVTAAAVAAPEAAPDDQGLRRIAAAPILSGLRAVALPDGSATIEWETDEATDATIEFGLTDAARDGARRDGRRARRHALVLSRLRFGRIYTFRVLSRNAAGEVTASARLPLPVPSYGVADSRLAQWRTGTRTGLAVNEAGDGELTLAPGGRTGAYQSRVLDSQQMVSWKEALMDAAVPAGTTLRLSARTGSTSTPDATWSAWTPLPAAGGRLGTLLRDSRYLQYRLDFTGNGTAAPVVRSVGFASSGQPPLEMSETGS